jgi:hypothetical protein
MTLLFLSVFIGGAFAVYASEKHFGRPRRERR